MARGRRSQSSNQTENSEGESAANASKELRLKASSKRRRMSQEKISGIEEEDEEEELKSLDSSDASVKTRSSKKSKLDTSSDSSKQVSLRGGNSLDSSERDLAGVTGHGLDDELEDNIIGDGLSRKTRGSKKSLNSKLFNGSDHLVANDRQEPKLDDLPGNEVGGEPAFHTQMPVATNGYPEYHVDPLATVDSVNEDTAKAAFCSVIPELEDEFLQGAHSPEPSDVGSLNRWENCDGDRDSILELVVSVSTSSCSSSTVSTPVPCVSSTVSTPPPSVVGTPTPTLETRRGRSRGSRTRPRAGISSPSEDRDSDKSSSEHSRDRATVTRAKSQTSKPEAPEVKEEENAVELDRKRKGSLRGSTSESGNGSKKRENSISEDVKPPTINGKIDSKEPEEIRPAASGSQLQLKPAADQLSSQGYCPDPKEHHTSDNIEEEISIKLKSKPKQDQQATSDQSLIEEVSKKNEDDVAPPTPQGRRRSTRPLEARSHARISCSEETEEISGEMKKSEKMDNLAMNHATSPSGADKKSHKKKSNPVEALSEEHAQNSRRRASSETITSSLRSKEERLSDSLNSRSSRRGSSDRSANSPARPDREPKLNPKVCLENLEDSVVSLLSKAIASTTKQGLTIKTEEAETSSVTELQRRALEEKLLEIARTKIVIPEAINEAEVKSSHVKQEPVNREPKVAAAPADTSKAATVSSALESLAAKLARIESGSASQLTAEERQRQAEDKRRQEEEDRKDVERRLRSFKHITENNYLCSRKISKQFRNMQCDCDLSEEMEKTGKKGCLDDCANRMLMIECGKDCPLDTLCANKRFQNKENSEVEVFKTEWKGFGVRAIKPIPPDTFVMEYVGEALDHKQFRRRAKQYARDNVEHFYFMALSKDCYVDATHKGNISRFINHSCEPNTMTQKWMVNGENRVGFFTTKNIAAGEELNFDYKYERYGQIAQKCYCGTPTCRGWLGREPNADSGIEEWTSSEEEEEEESMRRDSREERKREDKERRRKRRREHKQKKARVEEEEYEEDIQRLSQSGIRNKLHTVQLSRLMVRATQVENRQRLSRLLLEADQPCRRLFLDYQGLRILSHWMQDLEWSLSELDLKLSIQTVLRNMNVPHKTMLKDSKVYSIMEQWARSSPPSWADGTRDSTPAGQNSIPTSPSQLSRPSTPRSQGASRPDTPMSSCRRPSTDSFRSLEQSRASGQGDQQSGSLTNKEQVNSTSDTSASDSGASSIKHRNQGSTDDVILLAEVSRPSSRASNKESLPNNSHKDKMGVKGVVLNRVRGREVGSSPGGGKSAREEEIVKILSAQPSTDATTDVQGTMELDSDALGDLRAEPVPREEVSLSEEEERERRAIRDKVREVQTRAKELLAAWDLLQEMFRIPKKERHKIRVEHEREADRWQQRHQNPIPVIGAQQPPAGFPPPYYHMQSYPQPMYRHHQSYNWDMMGGNVMPSGVGIPPPSMPLPPMQLPPPAVDEQSAGQSPGGVQQQLSFLEAAARSYAESKLANKALAPPGSDPTTPSGNVNNQAGVGGRSGKGGGGTGMPSTPSSRYSNADKRRDTQVPMRERRNLRLDDSTGKLMKPGLPREERRKLFAAKIEEEERQKTLRAALNARHEQCCRLLGMNPKVTPHLNYPEEYLSGGKWLPIPPPPLPLNHDWELPGMAWLPLEAYRPDDPKPVNPRDIYPPGICPPEPPPPPKVVKVPGPIATSEEVEEYFEDLYSKEPKSPVISPGCSPSQSPRRRLQAPPPLPPPEPQPPPPPPNQPLPPPPHSPSTATPPSSSSSSTPVPAYDSPIPFGQRGPRAPQPTSVEFLNSSPSSRPTLGQEEGASEHLSEAGPEPEGIPGLQPLTTQFSQTGEVFVSSVTVSGGSSSSSGSNSPSSGGGAAMVKLPPKWRVVRDDSGRTYYYNINSKETRWEPPTDPRDEDREPSAGHNQSNSSEEKVSETKIETMSSDDEDEDANDSDSDEEQEKGEDGETGNLESIDNGLEPEDGELPPDQDMSASEKRMLLRIRTRNRLTKAERSNMRKIKRRKERQRRQEEREQIQARYDRHIESGLVTEHLVPMRTERDKADLTTFQEIKERLLNKDKIMMQIDREIREEERREREKERLEQERIKREHKKALAAAEKARRETAAAAEWEELSRTGEVHSSDAGVGLPAPSRNNGQHLTVEGLTALGTDDGDHRRQLIAEEDEDAEVGDGVDDDDQLADDDSYLMDDSLTADSDMMDYSDGVSSSTARRGNTTTAAADSDLEKKVQDRFVKEMSKVIVKLLDPYRKPGVKGYISTTEDFKHLAKKLTFTIMTKERAQCRHIEDLKVTSKVKKKAGEYVKKKMKKYEREYKRTPESKK